MTIAAASPPVVNRCYRTEEFLAMGEVRATPTDRPQHTAEPQIATAYVVAGGQHVYPRAS